MAREDRLVHFTSNPSTELTPARAPRRSDARAGSVAILSEREFQALVTETAELFGWLWGHWRAGQTKHGWRTPVEGPLGAGWPDLVLMRARDGRVIFAELKRDGAKLTAEQLELREYMTSETFLGRFQHVVWRPADFDRIVEVLQ